MPSRFSVPPRSAPGSSSLAWRILPWLLWGVVVAAEFTVRDGIRPGPVLAALPPLVAIGHGWRAVLASGVLALVTMTALNVHAPPPPGRAVALTTAVVIAVTTLVSALAAGARRRAERRLLRMHFLAGAVQQALLRPIPLRIGGYRVAGFYQAAEADARVGGDFYEALETPYGLRIVLGDVSGKGLCAIDAAVTLLGAFREAVYREEELTEVAHWMNRSLVRRQQATGDHRFATALLVEARPGGRLRLVNCGHVPPWTVDADGAHGVTLPAGALLGLFDSMLTRPLETVSHTLAPGSSLLAVTDGVTEARDAARAFYDPTRILGGEAHTRRNVGDGILTGRTVGDAPTGRTLGDATPTGRTPADCPETLSRTVLTGLVRHAGGRLTDDAAALVLTCPPAGSAGLPDAA